MVLVVEGMLETPWFEVPFLRPSLEAVVAGGFRALTYSEKNRVIARHLSMLTFQRASSGLKKRF